MKKKEIKSAYKIYEDASTLDEDRRSLLLEAFEASQTAHAPYSQFHVGAALLLEEGTVVKASNQENASSPEGLCAERVALYSAASRFPGIAFTRMAIVTGETPAALDVPATPCGGCRQSILEYERKYDHPIELLLRTKDAGPVYVFDSVNPLLPLSFDDRFLE